MPVAAQPFACGTTDERIREVDDLRLWGEARRAEMRAGGAETLAESGLQTRGNVVLLPADPINSPFRNPIRLEGRTVSFTRKDATTFGRGNTDLLYEERGDAVTSVAAYSYNLKMFAFPFFDRTHTRLKISPYNAIFLGEDPRTGSEQYIGAELAALRVPVIAPLWATPDSLPTQPVIYIREMDDRIVITWAVDVSTASYDVQATLFSSGDIRFSYRTLKFIRAGALVITSGEEAWRNQRQELGTMADATNDAIGTSSATLKPLLDIDRLTVNRIGDSNILEFRVKVGGQRNQFATGERATYYVYVADPSLRQTMTLAMSDRGEGTWSSPVWGSKSRALSAWMEADTIVFWTLQDYLAGVSGNVSVRAYSLVPGSSDWSDSVSLVAPIGEPRRRADTNFRLLTGDETSGPILEAFTLPPLNVGAAWSQIKNALQLRDDEWDAVAIYQNFYTDLILYAGAYSTGGNPGVRGIKTTTSIGPQFPRTPALLHMNKTGYGWNRANDLASHVALHEVGHRWLLSINIMENGTATRALNPASAHPAQYVHTQAPFRVLHETDASVMGGSTFRADSTNTTFFTPVFSNFSFSWLDLYLMGLASPNEVQPWFYITNSSPALGEAYYPPPESSFSGTRRDVTIDQVVAAMGQRVPAYPDTQKKFRVLVVLVTDPDRPVEEPEIAAVTNYGAILERDFALATGRRAEVSTSLPTAAGPRRRAAGR